MNQDDEKISLVTTFLSLATIAIFIYCIVQIGKKYKEHEKANEANKRTNVTEVSKEK